MKFYRQNTRAMPLSLCAFAALSLSIAIYGTFVSAARNEHSTLLFTWFVCGSICIFCLICACMAARQGLYVSEDRICYRRIRTHAFSYADITAVVVIPKAYHSRSGYELSYRSVKAGGRAEKVQVYAVFLMKDIYASEIDPNILGTNSLYFYHEYRKQVLGQGLYHPELIDALLCGKPEIDIIGDL